MNKFTLIVILSGLAGIVSAQEPGNPVVNISGQQQMNSPTEHARPMNEAEFSEFKGSYELSNGNTLFLFNRLNTKYAKVGDEASHVIDATSANSFVSKDKKLKMHIDLDDNGEVSGELFMAIEPKWVANNDVAVTEYESMALHHVSQ